jgi:hypothetical protein
MGNAKSSEASTLHGDAKIYAAKCTFPDHSYVTFFVLPAVSCHSVDDNEMFVIKKTWDDLAERSNGKGIDKDTFLQYFPLHGLLGGNARSS